MKLIEVSGDGREIGRQTGEALRDEIRQMLDQWKIGDRHTDWEVTWPSIHAMLDQHLPEVLAEMVGTAEGAGVAQDLIMKLNVPMYNFRSTLDLQECTNIAFSAGPDGPVWGKNNDGSPPGEQAPPVARLVRRGDGIPQLNFTFCGMVATLDGMNAEGLAIGHSSVGTVFGQSNLHVPIRLWGYEAMFRCRTTAEMVRFMASVPLRGKGYSSVVVDAGGAICSLEQPCPLTQVRMPKEGETYINCSNYYQLPALAEADARPPDGKRNAIARAELLDETFLGKDNRSLADMKSVLRYHGDPGICRHGAHDVSHTEYSMIGLPESRKCLYLHGYPCEGEYVEVQL